MGGYNEEQKGELALKNTLCTMGIYECMHYSFFSPAAPGSLENCRQMQKGEKCHRDHQPDQPGSVPDAYHTGSFHAECHFQK